MNDYSSVWIFFLNGVNTELTIRSKKGPKTAKKKNVAERSKRGLERLQNKK
jgi:hypothetical protein